MTQYFNSVDELYRLRLNAFIKLAGRYLYNRDYAWDAVHMALAKTLEYLKKNPSRNLREDIVNHLIIRACKKLNRFSRELPSEKLTYMTDITEE